MKRTVQAKLLVLAIFTIGVLTGFVLTDLYETRVIGDSGEPGREGRFRNRQSFSEFLELTEGQQVDVRVILEETREKFRTLRSQNRPMYVELTEQSRNQIREILNAEQLERYEGWIEDEGSRLRLGGRQNRNR